MGFVNQAFDLKPCCVTMTIILVQQAEYIDFRAINTEQNII